MKDILEYQGVTALLGSCDAIRAAFQAELVTDGELWIDMLDGRNLSAHSYDENFARQMVEDIQNRYIALFNALERRTQEMLEADR